MSPSEADTGQSGTSLQGAPVVDSLPAFLDLLRDQDDLLVVDEPVEPRFEMAAVLDGLGARGGKAALFPQVLGFPDVGVAGNVLGHVRRISLALGVPAADLRRAYLARLQQPVPPRTVALPDLEWVTYSGGEVDLLTQLPALTHHQHDTSPYLTCTVAVARDPDTGQLAMGLHRVQVRDEGHLAICLETPPLSRFIQRATQAGRPLEIAFVNGVHPATLIAAVSRCPTGSTKMEVAGGLLGRPLEVMPCRSTDLDVPADFQFLIEGVIEPGQTAVEGVFGESSGIYVEAVESPLVTVRRVTRRPAAVYQALQTWSPEDDALFDLCFGSDLLARLGGEFPFVRDLGVVGGTVAAHAVIQVDPCAPEDLRVALEQGLAHDPFLKRLIAVDEDIDIRDPRQVEWALATRFQADTDLVVLNGLPGSPIDPSRSAQGLTSKLAYDATCSQAARAAFRRVAVSPEMRASADALIDRVLARVD